MTIGIAANGIGAGMAVLAAWQEAERIGRGAIGGFAVFAVIPDGAGPVAVECQRGGPAMIRREWAGTGLLDLMARAPVAAVITSGPDRPVPLMQFLCTSRTGLVTGHRLPNLPDAGGVPLNISALRLIEGGVDPETAVTDLAAANPLLDAGLIAVTRDAVGLAETAHVRQRDDRGQALHRPKGAGLAILHNSITPVAGLAEAVAAAGLALLS